MHEINHDTEDLGSELIKRILSTSPYSRQWQGVETTEHTIQELNINPRKSNSSYTEIKFILDLEQYIVVIIETNNYELGSSISYPISYVIAVHPIRSPRADKPFFNTEIWAEDPEFDEFKKHMQSVKTAVQRRERPAKAV